MLNRAWPLQLPPVAKAVLIALADRADDDGVAWPSVGDLVTRTCFGRRAIQRAIGDLANAGLLSLGVRKGGFRKQTTIYRLVLPAAAATDDLDITWLEGRTSDQLRVCETQSATVRPTSRLTVAESGLTCARTINNHQEPSGTIIEPVRALRADPSHGQLSQSVDSFPCKHSSTEDHGFEGKGSQQGPASAQAEQQAPKPPRARPAPRFRGIAADWHPDAAGLTYAAQRGVNVSVEVEKFVDHHLQKGSPIADAAAAWRTWCRNHVDWARDRRSGPSPASLAAGNGGGLLGAVRRMVDMEEFS